MLPSNIADSEIDAVASILQRHDTSTKDALVVLQHRARTRDIARAGAASAFGFSGYAVGQIASTIASHYLGEHVATLGAPLLGDLLLCHLSCTNGDTIGEARLGPRYNPTPPIGPLAIDHDDRMAQTLIADRQFRSLGMVLMMSNAVFTYGLRLRTVPNLLTNMAVGFGASGFAGYESRTTARGLQLAGNAKRVEQWLDPSRHGLEEVENHVRFLRQPTARAILGYCIDVIKATAHYTPRNAIAALTSPRTAGMILASSPYTILGMIEKASKLPRFERAVHSLPAASYNALKWTVIVFGWGYRRETESAISHGSFTHEAAKKRASWLMSCSSFLKKASPGNASTQSEPNVAV